MQNYEEVPINDENECCVFDSCVDEKNILGLYEEVENAYEIDAPNDNCIDIDNCIETNCNTIEDNNQPLAKSIIMEPVEPSVVEPSVVEPVYESIAAPVEKYKWKSFLKNIWILIPFISTH